MIEVGKKLNGRYEILGNIGSGGMAHVFLANDLILNREVAIKVLRFDFQNDQTAIRRFQREALAATELVHPNIVSVYDVGEENDMQYLVMEFVRGMDLKRYIQTHYPIPYQTVVDIMDQILSAVSLAHEHRIIHRDLKPQNVLMDEEGTVKIADFGIAIALSETSITQTNTMLGSVHYLSPEQARGSMATKQSDIYAMGIILYELLVGQVPFDGESAVTIALKHFQDDLPDIREFNVNTPQSLINVVLHATAKDPADRYKTAEEMQIDLETVLNPERLNEPRWLPSAKDDEAEEIATVPETAPIPVPLSEEILPEDREDEPEKKAASPKKKNNKKRNIIIGAVVALAVILGVVLYAVGSGAPDVDVPNVSGMTEAEARSELEDVGLKVASEIREETSDEFEEGQVTRTNPEAGVNVREGREITLFVSTGAGTVELEDYTDMSYEDARDALLELGFTTGQIDRKNKSDDEVEEGDVISQNPDPGTELNPKDSKVKITLTVSSGPIEIDNYVGASYDSAVAAIEALGLKVEPSYAYSSSVARGIVISQDPAPGIVPAGSTVKLTVSQGEEPIEKVDIPDLTNRSQSYAEGALANLGLDSSLGTAEHSDTVPEGNVIRTNPSSGSSVDVGSNVEIILSSGPEEPEEVSISDYSGRSYESAASAIEALGLTVKRTNVYSDTVAANTVVSQDRPAGNVPAGSTITLTVSQGPDPAKNDDNSNNQNNN